MFIFFRNTKKYMLKRFSSAGESTTTFTGDLQATVFYDPTSTPDAIAKAGERMFIAVYGTPSTQSDLNRYRYTVFLKSCTKPKPDLSSLPPTKGSAK